MTAIFTLFKKDILLDTRQRHSFFAVLLYIASTIFIIKLAVDQPGSNVWNGLFWVVQLFICVNAVAKSFLQETRGKMLYFFTVTGPVNFVLAKLLYNLLLMLLMSLVSLGIFYFLLGNPSVNPGAFILITCFGGISISLVFTLLAAIAAKANQNAALMAILGFPLIIPQLMLLMRLSKYAFGEVFREGALLQLNGLLLGMDLLVIALAYILFPFLWKD